MLKSLVSRLFVGPAQSNYRLGEEARGRRQWRLAAHHYEQAVRLDEKNVAAWNDLGLARCEMRDFGGAREAFSRALVAAPEHAAANLNLGHLLRQEFLEFEPAEDHYRRALCARPGWIDALTGLALCLQEQGCVDEAIERYREVLMLDPSRGEVHEYLLFALNLLPGVPPETVYAEHRRWAARMEAGIAAPNFTRPGGARLRVGFVSGDFRAHATASMVLPVLGAMDRSRMEVYCYNSSREVDALTGRFAALADHWMDVGDMPAQDAAEAIRRDGIDVLVDLSGHTRGNRLDVFAQRPAPLAATWLGYLNTTGLEGMHCRITDPVVDPPGASERYHSETLLRLPDTLWCFETPADSPAIAAAGCGRPLAFGSCNHVAKLNAGVLAAWARLLRAVPASRLVVMAVRGERTAARIAGALASAGVEPDRLEFHGRLARDHYWRVLATIDIALDPFPYQGGATTLDCLWMGIPVVALAGRFGFARSAASILACIGLRDLVASDEDRYVAVAAELARDSTRLATLRATLRDALAASPLADARRFARGFEQGLLEAGSQAVRAREGRR